MKYRLTTFIVFLLLIQAGYAQIRSENLFYMVDTPESFESFRKNAARISIVCPQTFLVSKEGVLTGSVDRRVLEIARANGVKVMPLTVNKGFDQQLLHDIVSNPASRRCSIEMMLEYARRYGLDGWQFDLEGLHLSDRDSFTLYFRETAEAFHKEGLQLSAAVVHTLENVGGPGMYQRFLYENWRAGYALKELSEIGDFISVMTYDQHTRRTPPGPVAGIEWVEQVIQYLLSEGIAPGKISMGIPSYSVHWYADYSEERGGFSNGRQVGYDWVQHLLGKYGATPQWHEQAGCNYAFWDNGGVFEYLFIEDAESLKRKLEVLKKYNLRGISVWVLGKEDPRFWEVLREVVVKK
ncbi:MAG: hypothetical protein J5I98_18610 [Phaeodactylibacter sp.]|nr:hypothetical protein [Phaeodactylibacter sp.]